MAFEHSTQYVRLLQTLNLGIFRAIGHVGVYYGFKLGHQVAHCTFIRALWCHRNPIVTREFVSRGKLHYLVSPR